MTSERPAVVASVVRAALQPVIRPLRRGARRAELSVERRRAYRRRADVAIFQDFAPAPYGGGNQFLLALLGELERRGLRVETNTISRTTRACLFNSFNFDFDRLHALSRDGCRMVHRVDGPIGVYRGFDDGTDERIATINRELADATVLQSRWSLDRHSWLGIDLADPHVIHNGVDRRIFNADGAAIWDGRSVLRIVASSWSDNPRKGGPTYSWLDEQLDPARFSLTFVGRTKSPLRRGCMLPALPSAQLADVLRQHHIYLTASVDDPCSNALLEALACGLPAVFARSGGHPELVGDAGVGFAGERELLSALDRIADEYEERRAAIRVPRLADVADRYLAVLGLDADGCA